MITSALNPSRPTRVVNFAKILPLFSSPGTGLLPSPPASREVRLQVRPGQAARVSLLMSRPTGNANLKRLGGKKLTVPRTIGFLSRALGTSTLEDVGMENLSLPPGMPRFVNAATLKRMLKAKPFDTLLKRNGDSWDVCDNSLRIDLADASVEFRLGPVLILS